MSEGCEGCSISPRGQDSQLEQARKKAKDYVKEKQVAVAIYKEGFEWRFCEAGAAINGGYPIREIISEHNTNAA